MKHATTTPALDAARAEQPALVALADTTLDVQDAALPRDHPAWQRDVISISARTRALVANLRPFVVRVRSFWDHAVRRLTVGAQRLEIDASGSYRLR